MKSKSKIVVAVCALLCITTLLFTTACSFGKEALNNVDCMGSIYIDGEQTVVLEGSMSAMGDEAARFKSDISASDITFSGTLTGKKIVSVTYRSEESVQLVLSGKTQGASVDDADGMITVSGRATQNGSDSYCYVWVKKPQMITGGGSSSGSSTNKRFTSTFTIPYGTIAANAADYITLVNQNNGNIKEVQVVDEHTLKISVENFDPTQGENFPSVKIAAPATSFNVELVVLIGKAGNYDLV